MRASHIVIFVAVVAAGVVLAAAPVLAQQQKFPTKPIRLVVPNPAGGQADILTRMIGQKMSESWGRPVVVDNRPGAGGTLGAGMVAKATPDGYTLLATSPIFVISAALLPNLPYDPFKDFAGVTHLGFATQALIVAPALNVKSVKDLIARAQAQPGKILFGSSPVGSNVHLSGERFRFAAGIKVVTVAFKGSPEALIETLAGRTHYGFPPLPVALPFIKDGKLLALAVNTPQRSPLLPEVPALAETLPEFKRNEGGAGLLAPAKTPRPILNQISTEVSRILNLPDIRERVQGMGFVVETSTPEEHDKMLRAQIETLSKVVRDAGLRAK